MKDFIAVSVPCTVVDICILRPSIVLAGDVYGYLLDVLLQLVKTKSPTFHTILGVLIVNLSRLAECFYLADV